MKFHAPDNRRRRHVRLQELIESPREFLRSGFSFPEHNPGFQLRIAGSAELTPLPLRKRRERLACLQEKFQKPAPPEFIDGLQAEFAVGNLPRGLGPGHVDGGIEQFQYAQIGRNPARFCHGPFPGASRSIRSRYDALGVTPLRAIIAFATSTNLLIR